MAPQCLRTPSISSCIPSWGLTAHPSAASSMYPRARTPQLSKLSHMKTRSNFVLSGTKLFYLRQPLSGAPLLSASPAQLCHAWDSVKGHRRFLQVKTHTSEPVNSHMCDAQRTDTKLCQRSLGWYPHSSRLNPSPIEKV